MDSSRLISPLSWSLSRIRTHEDALSSTRAHLAILDGDEVLVRVPFAQRVLIETFPLVRVPSSPSWNLVFETLCTCFRDTCIQFRVLVGNEKGCVSYIARSPDSSGKEATLHSIPIPENLSSKGYIAIHIIIEHSASALDRFVDVTDPSEWILRKVALLPRNGINCNPVESITVSDDIIQRRINLTQIDSIIDDLWKTLLRTLPVTPALQTTVIQLPKAYEIYSVLRSLLNDLYTYVERSEALHVHALSEEVRLKLSKIDDLGELLDRAEGCSSAEMSLLDEERNALIRTCSLSFHSLSSALQTAQLLTQECIRSVCDWISYADLDSLLASTPVSKRHESLSHDMSTFTTRNDLVLEDILFLASSRIQPLELFLCEFYRSFESVSNESTVQNEFTKELDAFFEIMVSVAHFMKNSIGSKGSIRMFLDQRKNELINLSTKNHETQSRLKGFDDWIEQRRSTQQKLIQAKSDLLQAKYELLKRTYEREKSLLFEDSEEELHAVEQRMQFAKGLVERKENEFQALFDEVLISSPLSPHVGFQLMTESSSMSLSGLEVARRFSDYRIVRQLSPNVYHSEYNGRPCVLRAFDLVCGNSNQLANVWAVHRLRHPAIVSVEAYFFESTLLFVQTPLIEGPSLRDWLHTLNRTDLHTRIYDIGIVYQRLLQALIYMHQHGVVNLGLCLDNVVLDAHMQPVIVNFDYAVESGMYDRIRVSQRDGGVSVAPELRRFSSRFTSSTRTIETGINESCSSPSREVDFVEVAPSVDMYSLGVMLFQSFCGVDTIPEFDPDTHSLLNFSRMDAGISAIELTSHLLSWDPSLRPSAVEALQHKFFNSYLKTLLVSSGINLTQQNRLQAFREIIGVIRNRNDMMEGRKDITIDRENLFQEVLDNFSSFEGPEFKKCFFIIFKGEDGVDQGGLLTNLYSSFFDELLRKSPYLDVSDRSQPAHGLPRATETAGSTDWDVFRTVGIVLAKCLMDARMVPSHTFAPFLYKYLAGEPPSFRDLEVFEPEIASSTRSLLVSPNVEDWMMSFDLVGGDPERIVCDDNKEEFARAQVRHRLLDVRSAALEKIREGFLWCAEAMDFVEAVRMLRYEDLLAVLVGETKISASQLLGVMDMSRSMEYFQVVEFFMRMVQKWEDEGNGEKLIKFLEFSTGLPALPSGRLYNPNSSVLHEVKIQIVPKPNVSGGPAFIPQAHLCSYQIDIYPYESFEEFEDRFNMALEWGDSGFHIQ